MGASYRAIQADFSSGEIDPMVEANVNLPYRQSGLRESYNTLHLPNATVSKRPGLIREISAPFGSIASHGSWTMVEVQMESGETADVFLGTSARVILDGSFYDVPIYASEDAEETETISLSAGLRHTGVYQQYIFISYPEDETTGFLVLKIEKDETAGVRVYSPSGEVAEHLRYPDDIGPCTRPIAVTNGRLLLGSRNVFNASCQRTEDQKETETGFPSWMVDFTLSDWQYDWTYKYSLTTEDGYEISETVVYESFDEEPPADPFSKPDGIIKRVRVILKEDEGAGTWQEWTVTDNYEYGEVTITDIILREKAADGTVETHTSETYPDKEAYPNNPTTEEKRVPDVQSTHAIQVRENDFYGASIKWIAAAGRVIAGTETAIFAAVDQYLDPQTFDFAPPASYTGASALQPKLLNQYMVFASSDRKKLYMAVYSDEMKGLSIVEATQNVKHLFLSGIKDYFISDNPYRVIYVITNDGECRVCIPSVSSDGTMAFAWSTWDFGAGKVEYVCFDRRAEDEPRTYFIMRDDDTEKGWIYRLDYREPYLYGLKDTELLLDYADIMTVKNEREDVELSSPFLHYYGSVDVMLTYSDGRQVVLRDVAVTAGEDGTASVHIDYERDDMAATADVTMKVGRSYETRIGLFQQILPNNTGISLVTKHSIDRLYLQIYRSQGGSVYHGDAKVADILQLRYGHDLYNDNATNPLTGTPYTFSGTYTIDNPVQNVTDDDLSIITADPYPFNLMAVSMRYTLTEVY